MAAAETDEKGANERKDAAEQGLAIAEDRQHYKQQDVADIENIKSGDVKKFILAALKDKLSCVSQTVRDATAKEAGKAAFAFVEGMNAQRGTARESLNAARKTVEDLKKSRDEAVHAASKATKRVRRAKRERKAKDAEAAAEEASKLAERLRAEANAASDSELEEDGEKSIHMS